MHAVGTMAYPEPTIKALLERALSAPSHERAPDTRLEDALDDVKRLHGEKMKFFERVIELERDLAYWMPKERPQYGAGGSRDVDVAEAQRKWDAFHAAPRANVVPLDGLIQIADEEVPSGPDDVICTGCGTLNNCKTVRYEVPGEAVEYDLECLTCGSREIEESYNSALHRVIDQRDALQEKLDAATPSSTRALDAAQQDAQFFAKGVLAGAWSVIPKAGTANLATEYLRLLDMPSAMGASDPYTHPNDDPPGTSFEGRRYTR